MVVYRNDDTRHRQCYLSTEMILSFEIPSDPSSFMEEHTDGKRASGRDLRFVNLNWYPVCNMIIYRKSVGEQKLMWVEYLQELTDASRGGMWGTTMCRREFPLSMISSGVPFKIKRGLSKGLFELFNSISLTTYSQKRKRMRRISRTHTSNHSSHKNGAMLDNYLLFITRSVVYVIILISPIFPLNLYNSW